MPFLLSWFANYLGNALLQDASAKLYWNVLKFIFGGIKGNKKDKTSAGNAFDEFGKKRGVNTEHPLWKHAKKSSMGIFGLLLGGEADAIFQGLKLIKGKSLLSNPLLAKVLTPELKPILQKFGGCFIFDETKKEQVKKGVTGGGDLPRHWKEFLKDPKDKAKWIQLPEKEKEDIPKKNEGDIKWHKIKSSWIKLGFFKYTDYKKGFGNMVLMFHQDKGKWYGPYSYPMVPVSLWEDLKNAPSHAGTLFWRLWLHSYTGGKGTATSLLRKTIKENLKANDIIKGSINQAAKSLNSTDLQIDNYVAQVSKFFKGMMSQSTFHQKSVTHGSKKQINSYYLGYQKSTLNNLFQKNPNTNNFYSHVSPYRNHFIKPKMPANFSKLYKFNKSALKHVNKPIKPTKGR